MTEIRHDESPAATETPGIDRRAALRLIGGALGAAVLTGCGGGGSSSGTTTTQLFFPRALISTINTPLSPYSAHGTNPTTNAGDRVYTSQTHAENELTLSGDATSGYTAAFAIHLPVTSEEATRLSPAFRARLTLRGQGAKT